MSNRLFCCDQMQTQIDTGIIKYDIRFDEFSFIVRHDDEVEVRQRIRFCPWSGDPLPEGYRERWFEELEAMGLDPLNDSIPAAYQSDAWRIS